MAQVVDGGISCILGYGGAWQVGGSDEDMEIEVNTDKFP